MVNGPLEQRKNESGSRAEREREGVAGEECGKEESADLPVSALV